MPQRLRVLLLTLAVVLWCAAAGCTSRRTIDPGVPAYGTSQSVSVAPRGDTPDPAAPTAPRPKATLHREPEVGVLLMSGARIRFTLLAPARIGNLTISPGQHDVTVRPGGLLLDDLRLPADASLTMDGPALSPGARFAAELTPPFGARQRLEFAGMPRLVLNDGRVQLIERIPLEGYLAGVVPIEMNPKWPLEALRAQAIAARTYAAAKWLPRAHRPWQLHWHYSVDMAYAGLPGRTSANAIEAVRSTRGQILTTGGQPFPALFHASSGGRTENAVAVWPTLAAADGRSATGVMPSVDDPACEPGTKGLKLNDPHWRWKNDIPLHEVTTRLRAWANEKPADRPSLGSVTDIRILERSPSGRVAVVEVVHKEGGKTRRTQLRANDFRLAVGPTEVASTWWDKCVVVKAKGGTLALAGRGYGHGVGLSQVSAWQMAREGSSASAITARFYPEAVIATPYP